MNTVSKHDALKRNHAEDYIAEIPTNKIKANPYQPRKEFTRSALYDLANSIKEYGILQPISVRPLRGDNTYELVAGERRLRAAKIAGLDTVPAIVCHIDENDSAILALVENLQRENLSFLEEAEGYYCLLIEHGMTQEELARKVGKSQSSIANKIRLLKLPPMVKKILCDNKLSERHARALLRMADEQLQLKALKMICEKHCSVKEAEEIIDKLIEKHNNNYENDRGYLMPVPPTPVKKSGTVKFVIKDIKIFVNTIKETIAILKRSGVEAKAAQFDRGDYFEFIVRIPKAANGLVINNGISQITSCQQLNEKREKTS